MMEITNEQTEETKRLTVADLGVAAWACSELYNYMLEGYEQEDYGDLSKEQMEQTLTMLRSSFVKFDSLAEILAPKEEEPSSCCEAGSCSETLGE